MDSMRYRTKIDGDCVTAFLCGAITYGSHFTAYGLLRDIRKANPARIVLDLDGVQKMDSTGFGVLLLVRQFALERHAKIILARPSEAILRVIERFRFESLFEVAPNANGTA